MACENMIVAGLPKSSNVYLFKVFFETMACKQFSFCSSVLLDQQILSQEFFKFVDEKNVVGGEHMAPSAHNLNLLEVAGIDRIAVLVRDPRDAVVSWWHHLERPDVKSWPWHAAMLAASGIQSRNYYELTWEEKLADLIERMYPSMQAWLMMWAKVIKDDPGFEFYLVKYEDLVANPEENYRKLFRFFGHDVNPVLPPKKTSDTLIDIGTHFRRGVVGSFRDEVPQNLMPQLQKLFDTRLTEFFGWRE